MKKKLLVIGAGISGLTVAQNLKSRYEIKVWRLGIIVMFG